MAQRRMGYREVCGGRRRNVSPQKPEQGAPLFPLLESWYQAILGNNVTAGKGLRCAETGAGKVIYSSVSGAFTGEAWIRGQRYYDSMLTSDTTGTAITDNSGGEKAWLKVVVSGPAVTYESGPPPHPFPQNEEWYRCENCGQVHIPGF